MFGFSVPRFAPALVLAAAVSGCASAEAERANRAQAALIGMPKEALLACAGAPLRTGTTADGREVLAYERRQTIVHRRVDYEENELLREHGIRAVRPEVSMRANEYACAATFALRNGVVEALEYNQGRDLQLCHAIVANCVGP